MNLIVLLLWLVPLALVAFLILVYEIKIKVSKPDEIWAARHSLFATLVSVLIGISVAIGLFNAQTYVTDQQRRNNLMRQLGAFVSETQRKFDTEDKDKLHANIFGLKRDFVVTHIHPFILEEAIRSGLFNDQETELMLLLHSKISSYNAREQFLLSLLPSLNDPLTKPIFKFAIDQLVSQQEVLMNDLQVLSAFMKLPPAQLKLPLELPKPSSSSST